MATALAGPLAVGSGSRQLPASVYYSFPDGGQRTSCCRMLVNPGLNSWTVAQTQLTRCENRVISSSQCLFLNGGLSSRGKLLASDGVSASTCRRPSPCGSRVCAGKVPRFDSKHHNDGALTGRHSGTKSGKNVVRYSDFQHDQGHRVTGPGFRERAKNVQVSASLAERSGKVGVYGRLGNVALASFGLKQRLPFKKQVGKMDVSKALSRMLPFVVCATAVASLTYPPSFSWFSKKYYAAALGGIMLSIGVQLSVKDFAVVFQRPLPVLLGFIGQYVIKPVIGLAVVTAFRVPPLYSAGLLLTASVAGAQLSSYATFLSDGDVAFSIVLTSLTTVASVAFTPFLTQALIGSVVPVDVAAMAKSILQVVILPVFAGLALNTYAKPVIDRVRPAMPLVAMLCTALCIGSPLAMNQKLLMTPQGLHLLLPVLLFHLLSFAAGFWFCRVPGWRQEPKVARTISLCTGMQSSTLAMLLASQFLGPTHLVPPACSVVVMAIMGLSLGSFWGKGSRIREVLGFFRRQSATALPSYN